MPGAERKIVSVTKTTSDPAKMLVGTSRSLMAYERPTGLMPTKSEREYCLTEQAQ